MKHRLIGDIFPIEHVSKHSSKEKHIRKGNPSTLHIWWARRPLASSRATIYASLVGTPKNLEEWATKGDFIEKLSRWENTRNRNVIEKAKSEIYSFYNSKPPKVLDPFAGGGSIPLEALRLGCETYASDYNPVATIILKCVLEYPSMFEVKNQKSIFESNTNKLQNEVKKWGKIFLKKCTTELEQFYPQEEGKETISAYLWTKTIPCQNPNCGITIPLFRQFWLCNKPRKKISLYPYIKNNEIKFKIVGDKYSEFPNNFEPSKGTVSKSIVKCLSCGFIIEAKTTRKLFKEKKSGEQIVAVVSTIIGESGKKYRLSTDQDHKIVEDSKKYLENISNDFKKTYGLNPIPDELLPKERTRGSSLFNVILYGFEKWGELFNPRQKLALVIFCKNIREIHDEILKEDYEPILAKAICTYLALLIDKISSSSNRFCRWQPNGEKIADVFGRHNIPMVWDYPEANILGGKSRSFSELFEDVLKNISTLYVADAPANVQNMSATKLEYENEFFDGVFTDPPYYDNIMYGDLSEFFYVWLKRSIGFLYPELFVTPSVQKTDEIVADIGKHGDRKEASLFFNSNLKKAFKEIFRVLKKDGICVVVYAHKSFSGWETLIDSLLDSGFVITAAWPIHTEMKTRLLGKESAVLGSSIYMVARKWEKEEIGFYREIKKDLEKHLIQKLEKLWEQGISGADFFISAIGASIEIFGKYEKIIDDNDNPITSSKLLEDVRKIVTDYTMNRVLHGSFSENISQLTRFYLLSRWAYGFSNIPFSEALKLTQSIGVDIEHEWNKGFIKKEKDFIRILGPSERKINSLENHEMIDVLHKVVMLWKNNKRKEMIKVLKDSEFGNSDVFYKVAQAISESNPGSSESKLLDGFLSSRTKILDDISLYEDQTKLD